jgi:hypothetical protein
MRVDFSLARVALSTIPLLISFTFLYFFDHYFFALHVIDVPYRSGYYPFPKIANGELQFTTFYVPGYIVLNVVVSVLFYLSTYLYLGNKDKSISRRILQISIGITVFLVFLSLLARGLIPELDNS